MSKVILTQEQAEIIEETKFALAGFSNEILVRCLNGEYEVVPEFKVGDWVHNNVTGRVAKIDDRGYDEEVAWVDDDKVNFFTQFRHATPEEIAEEKERRLFARHGRKVWELRKNDILYNPWLGIRTVFHIRENGKVSFAENHKEYEIDEIKESYRVACFAENRLDVKDDE